MGGINTEEIDDIGENNNEFYKLLSTLNTGEDISKQKLVINRIHNNYTEIESLNSSIGELELMIKTFTKLIESKLYDSDEDLKYAKNILYKAPIRINKIKEDVNSLVEKTKMNISFLLKEGIKLPEELKK